MLPWPDIGHLAKWSVSSFKFGFGPECLQDQDPDTFWQSVPIPHTHTHIPSLTPSGPLFLSFFSLARMVPSRTL